MSKRVPHIAKVCLSCTGTFTVQPCRADQIYCSKECSDNSKRLPDQENFWRKVNKSGPLPNIPNWTLGACWLWKAYTTHRGYGVFAITGIKYSHPVRAHRWAYESEFGPIPKDRPVLDHLCRVRNCVRPSHLEPVTCGENIRRGQTGKWQIKASVVSTERDMARYKALTEGTFAIGTPNILRGGDLA